MILPKKQYSDSRCGLSNEQLHAARSRLVAMLSFPCVESRGNKAGRRASFRNEACAQIVCVCRTARVAARVDELDHDVVAVCVISTDLAFAE